MENNFVRGFVCCPLLLARAGVALRGKRDNGHTYIRIRPSGYSVFVRSMTARLPLRNDDWSGTQEKGDERLE